MNILICYMYYDKAKGLSCSDGVVNAFRQLGHHVVTCGPDEGNYSGNLTSKHDIPVYDKKQHPETYEYDYILDLYNKKYGTYPELILQIDPHFYFIGNKPKNIFTAYWITDPHRGPNVFAKMALEGNFDKTFIIQKYYMPVYQRYGIECAYLPNAYDNTVIFEQPDIDTECDIAFIGSTGIKNETLMQVPHQYDDELNLYYRDLRGYYWSNDEKFIGWDNRSLEYAERAELLLRLSQDFDVRIYERCFDVKYAQALSRGKIVFHHSLRRDITLRIFEGMAVNRLVVADEIPYLYEFFNNNVNIALYRSYYQPQFASFDFDYAEVKSIVQYYLSNNIARSYVAKSGMQTTIQNHAFVNRVNDMLKICFS